MTVRAWWLSSLAALSTLSCREPAEGEYRYTRLDAPGATSTIASGINASGHIVGWYRDSTTDRVRGFIYRDGTYTPVDYPDAALTQVNGIGPDGNVVGSYRKAGEPDVNFHGFLFTTTGQFSDVSVAGHTNSVAQRLLPDGTILGCYHGDNWTTTMRGVTFTAAGANALDVPATMSNGGTPDRRMIVGLVMDTGRAFVVNDGVVTFFDIPGSLRTEAWDISPSGMIVGLFEDSSSTAHGFFRQGEIVTRFDYPGAASTMIFGTNAAGAFVGAAQDSAGRTHGFVGVRTRRSGE